MLEQIIPPDSNQPLRSLLRNPLAKDTTKTKRDNGRAMDKSKEDTEAIIRPGYSSESQFACRHCGKRYRWKSTMRRHELVECGGKEPSFQCPHCPYRAKQKGNLGVHIRKHHS